MSSLLSWKAFSIMAVMGLNIGAFLTTYFHVSRFHIQPDDAANSATAAELERDSELFIPLDKLLVAFEDASNFGLYGEQANAEWLATTPEDNGYVHVGEDHRLRTVVFGHEMHCIRTIRMAIAYPRHPYATVQHASHCLNYLRMYVLCDPDLTLEGYDPLEGNFSMNEATHVCRDWKGLYDGLARNVERWTEQRNGTAGVI